MSSSGTTDEPSTQGGLKEQKSLFSNLNSTIRHLANSKYYVHFLRCCEMKQIIPTKFKNSSILATIERLKFEGVDRILSAKFKKMKDALSKKLDKNLYDSIILKLQISLQRKLTENKKKKENKLEELKSGKNYTEDLYCFEEMAGAFIKDFENQIWQNQKQIKIKSFSCNQCLKEFPTYKGLENHLRTHTGVNLFMCDQCPKVFQSNSDLKKHFRTHTGEGCKKSFCCNQCPKTFSNYVERKVKLVKTKKLKRKKEKDKDKT